MVMPIKDLTGKTYGRLTVLERHFPKTKEKYAHWKVHCRCGTVKILSSNYLLRTGKLGVKSCGKCRDAEKYPAEYKAWMNMHNRCYNVNYPQYHRYGGREITVSLEWRLDFLNFYDDVGPRPENKSLDRTDNNLGYCKENCTWATQQEQVDNRDCARFKLCNYLPEVPLDTDPSLG